MGLFAIREEGRRYLSLVAFSILPIPQAQIMGRNKQNESENQI
jgi:hypothetical protein